MKTGEPKTEYDCKNLIDVPPSARSESARFQSLSRWTPAAIIALFMALCSYSLMGNAQPKLQLQSGNTSLFLNAVVIASNGKTIVVGGSDGVIKAWSPESKLTLWTKVVHGGQVDALALNSDKQRLLSGGADKKACLLELSTGSVSRCFTVKVTSISTVALSLDGNWAAVGGGDGFIEIWGLQSGDLFKRFRAHTTGISALSFSFDSQSLASGSKDGTVEVWEFRSNVAAHSVVSHSSEVTDIAFDRNGRTLASSGYDHVIKLASLDSQIPRSDIPVPGVARAIVFDPQANNITAIVVPDATSGPLKYPGVVRANPTFINMERETSGQTGNNLGATIEIQCITWSLATSKEVRRFATSARKDPSLFEFSGNWPVKFSDDAVTFAFASDFNTIQLLRTSDGTEIGTMGAVAEPIDALAFSASGRWLAAGSGDHNLRLWDALAAREQLIQTGYKQSIKRIEFSPDSETMTSVSDDGRVDVWESRSGKHLESITGNSHAVYGDGQRVAWEDHKTISIRSVKTKTVVAKVPIQTPYEVSEIDLSPDGKWLAIYDHLASDVSVWNVETGKPSGHTRSYGLSRSAFQFTPDDSRIAWGSLDGSITLFDYVNNQTKRFCCHTARGGINGISISNDGHWLASVGEDQQLKVWSTDPESTLYRSGQPLYVLSGQTGSVRSVAFSPNGKLLISGSDDGTATVWDRDKGLAIADLVALSQGNGWTAAMRSGLFDGTADGIRNLGWQEAGVVYPLNQLYNDFFYPGLVSDILSGNEPPPPNDLGAKLRMPALREMAEQGLAHIETVDGKDCLCLPPTLSSTALKDISVQTKGGNTLTLEKQFIDDSTKPGCKRRVILPSGTGPWELSGTRSGWKPASGTRSLMSNTDNAVLYVVTVGISNYEQSVNYYENHGPYSQLPLAAGDADSIRQFFIDQKLQHRSPFKDVNVSHSLRNSEATLVAIRNEFELLAKETKPEDVVLLFLSGHGSIPLGQEMFYFMPYVAPTPDGGFLYRQESEFGLSTAMLADAVRALPARRIAIIVDACESGGIMDSLAKVAQAKNEINERMTASSSLNGSHADSVLNYSGVYVVAAAVPGQPAAEPIVVEGGMTDQHGILTSALLKALKEQSPDEQITMGVLEDRVVQIANDLAIKMGAIQTTFPYGIGNDFLIAK